MYGMCLDLESVLAVISIEQVCFASILQRKPRRKVSEELCILQVSTLDKPGENKGRALGCAKSHFSVHVLATLTDVNEASLSQAPSLSDSRPALHGKGSVNFPGVMQPGVKQGRTVTLWTKQRKPVKSSRTVKADPH